MRSIHDASAGLPVPDDWQVLLPANKPDLLCHNDLATWNLVVDGDRLVFIDWDGAGPSTRLGDLAYAAISFGHLFPDADARGAEARLAAFVDGYRADPGLRAALPATMMQRAAAMPELLRRSHDSGREPWGSTSQIGFASVSRPTAAACYRWGRSPATAGPRRGQGRDEEEERLRAVLPGRMAGVSPRGMR